MIDTTATPLGRNSGVKVIEESVGKLPQVLLVFRTAKCKCGSRLKLPAIALGRVTADALRTNFVQSAV